MLTACGRLATTGCSTMRSMGDHLKSFRTTTSGGTGARPDINAIPISAAKQIKELRQRATESLEPNVEVDLNKQSFDKPAPAFTDKDMLLQWWSLSDIAQPSGSKAQWIGSASMASTRAGGSASSKPIMRLGKTRETSLSMSAIAKAPTPGPTRSARCDTVQRAAWRQDRLPSRPRQV